MLNESETFDEMNDFGVNSRGSYTSQSSHDDIAMTCVNLSPMLSSYSYSELVEEIIDDLPNDHKQAMQKKLENIDRAEDVSLFDAMKSKAKYPYV
jgi:formate dehydrogenase maturation protein FdhE